MLVNSDYYHFLKNIYAFNGLESDDIKTILKYCKEDQFKAGEIIFQEGDQADRFYIIVKGIVEVWKAWQTSDADMLAVHKDGRLFGEMAIVDGLPRSATLIARTDTSVLYIDNDNFQTIIKENSSVAFSIIKSLSAMVRKSNETFLEDLKIRNRKLEKAYKELQEAQLELLQKERLSNLGKFSSMVLHDIRNPISIVKAYTDLLLSHDVIPEKERAYIENIKFEAERLHHLANEFLDYSRGEIRLNMQIILLPDFFKKLEEWVEHRFTTKSIRIILNNACNHAVMFDEDRMIRVLMNLLDNARKAVNSQGKISIEAVCDDAFLTFKISDNGEGMDKETLDHLYEPFYSSSKKGGTGLGMVIVKSIIEAHGGALTVVSSIGKGTEVTIKLPMRT